MTEVQNRELEFRNATLYPEHIVSVPLHVSAGLFSGKMPSCQPHISFGTTASGKRASVQPRSENAMQRLQEMNLPNMLPQC